MTPIDESNVWVASRILRTWAMSLADDPKSLEAHRHNREVKGLITDGCGTAVEPFVIAWFTEMLGAAAGDLALAHTVAKAALMNPSAAAVTLLANSTRCAFTSNPRCDGMDAGELRDFLGAQAVAAVNAIGRDPWAWSPARVVDEAADDVDDDVQGPPPCDDDEDDGSFDDDLDDYIDPDYEADRDIEPFDAKYDDPRYDPRRSYDDDAR